jgi:hypothetical protein
MPGDTAGMSAAVGRSTTALPPSPDVVVVGRGGWQAGRDQAPPTAFGVSPFPGVVVCHRSRDEMLPQQLAGLRHRGGPAVTGYATVLHRWVQAEVPLVLATRG